MTGQYDFKYVLKGEFNSTIEVSWEYQGTLVNIVTYDEYDRHGEADFHKTEIIAYLETLLNDLKGDQ